MNQQIYHPHLYLFVYNLRNGLGQNASKIADNHQKFWEKLPDDLKVCQSAEEEFGYTENIVDLLKLHPNTEIKNHKFSAFQETEAEFNGFYYPVRLNDTYGLLFSFSVNEQSKTTPKDISVFGEMRHFPKTEQASKSSSSYDLGKTWMLAGYLPPDFIKLEENKEKELEEQAKTIASEAYEKFTGNKWQYYENGKFLNGWIFEVWQPPHNWENLDENHHVLIIIYTNLESMEKSAQFYEHWLRLFSYRNKILWAYSNSQSNNEKIVKANKNSDGESFYPRLPKDLEQLKEALRDNYPTLQDYSHRISFLEIQLHTIDVNRKNYKKRLDIITEQSKKEGGDHSTNLNFLEEFIDVAEKKYQEQIKNDCAVLESGLRVREKFIDTIKGIVEIEQANLDKNTAERDRSFQQNVQVLGVGFATAGFTATAISPFMEKIIQPLAESVQPKPKEKQTSLQPPSVQSSQSKTIAKQLPPPPTSIWWVSWVSLLLTVLVSLGVGCFCGWVANKVVKSRYNSTSPNRRPNP